MSQAGHVYDWLRARGYWLARDADERPTHLMLDGGKARVPEESAAAFLNAYAASLVRFPDRRPCLVELRTPVFRMFLDLDTRFEAPEAAAAALRDGLPAAVMRAVAAEVPGPALVCASSAPKTEQRGAKLGFHVVWPDVRVTAGTALELRRRLVARLDAEAPVADVGVVPGAGGGWDGVVDAVVYKSSGLRLPWSAKGRDDGRYYDLRWHMDVDGSLRPAEAPAGVAALRDAVSQLSVRCWGQPTLHIESAHVDESAAAGGGSYVAKSLGAYADVLPRLADALPVQFLGQKFTGLMAGEHCVMLRSTARYCFNLGRQHNTNNVYFLLTRRGVCQRCYCRCETTEGRRYGMCKDFSSACWAVPRDVLDAFFPAAAADGSGDATAGASGGSTTSGSVSLMPSRSAETFLAMDAIEARARRSRKRGRRGA